MHSFEGVWVAGSDWGVGCAECIGGTDTQSIHLIHPIKQAGKLAEAVELLMAVEKQARMGNDVPSLKEVCLFAVRLVRCALVLARMGDCWDGVVADAIC